jgi:hypothetical protein
MAEKKLRLRTPVGICKWAHVVKPKPAFEGKGPGHYMIDVMFNPAENSDWKAWANDLLEKVKAIKGKQSPLKKELDEEGNETGMYYVTFKTSEKYRPPVYDRFGKPMDDVNVGNGSKVRVAYTENEYPGFGKGINLYFDALQVLELVEYKSKSAAAFGFDVDAEPEPTDDGLAPF